MRIIFLDIDGVLNSQKYFIDNCWKINEFYKNTYQDTVESLKMRKMLDIDLEKLRLLKQIIDCCKAKVVVISSWKKLKVYSLIKEELIKIGIPIIGETIDNNDNRGFGIKEYLRENPNTDYIILDDDIFPDYDEGLLSHLIKTNFYENGLDEEAKNKAIKKLRMK